MDRLLRTPIRTERARGPGQEHACRASLRQARSAGRPQHRASSNRAPSLSRHPRQQRAFTTTRSKPTTRTPPRRSARTSGGGGTHDAARRAGGAGGAGVRRARSNARQMAPCLRAPPSAVPGPPLDVATGPGGRKRVGGTCDRARGLTRGGLARRGAPGEWDTTTTGGIAERSTAWP